MLDDAQLDELVWLDLVVAGDEKATQTAIYWLQQTRLDRLSEEEIAAWVVRLHHRALLLRRILRPAEEPVLVLREALDRLARWGSIVVHPIALHVLEAHVGWQCRSRRGGTCAAGGGELPGAPDARRHPTNNLNRILMSLVKELAAGAPTAATLTGVLSGPRKRFPSDQQVRDAVLVEPFTSAAAATSSGTSCGRLRKTCATVSGSTSTSPPSASSTRCRRARRSGG